MQINSSLKRHNHGLAMTPKLVTFGCFHILFLIMGGCEYAIVNLFEFIIQVEKLEIKSESKYPGKRVQIF